MFISFYEREINIAQAEMSQTLMFEVGTRRCRPDANLYPFFMCGVCRFPVGSIRNNCDPLKKISQADQQGAHSDEGNTEILQKSKI